MAKRDYYEVLGVGKNASADEIKKAFRKAAIQHHPDKEGGDETKFKEINEAYEVLKDDKKRQRYDQFGHAGVGGASSGGNPYEGFSGFGGQGQEVHFDFGDIGLGDLFGSFFGGGQRQRSNHQTRGRDVETSIEISFEQAVFGTEVDLDLSLEDSCEHCKGTTVEPGYELKICDECKGTGQVTRVMRTVFGNIQQPTACPKCDGRGKIPEKICTVCRGKGTQRKSNKIGLKIPAGVDDGATIRLREHGEAVANGSKGDLYVNIRVKSHKKFTREGDLILSEEKIGMVDAALGTEIEVDTVDGRVAMKIPAGTQSGTDFRLSNHGVPHLKSNVRGAHIVTIVVDTPTKLTKKQQELLQEFQNSSKRGLF
ncbi:molecular chaperone DnaJ [Candidatus Saccharibacteria bacterium]|nr:molecular chaperone DnaJ [Candidatus Saccharibacteria bacterium]MBI3338234.1 molecular chaperone DnaJ [Candidatus Saccharibacteria bacterium]